MKKKELLLDEKLINIPMCGKDGLKTSKNIDNFDKTGKFKETGSKLENKLANRLKQTIKERKQE